MELANCLVALGGDSGNTVPKEGLTPAEIALLREIHGDDSILDLEPTGETVARSAREEVARLAEVYPAKDGEQRLLVAKIFSASGVGVPMTIDDLNLPDNAFKVLSRVTTKKGSPASAAPVASAKAAKRGKAKPAPAPAPEPEPADENSADHLFEDDEADESTEDSDEFIS